MNYNTTYWRKIRNGTCYSQVRHFVLMSLLLFWRMTSDCPSRPFARCKTADFVFWAEQNVRETSRFFTKKPGGGPRLSEISCTYDPPIYDITSGCRVAALLSREARRWTPDAIWFSRYFYPQANGIMYLEYREC